MADQIRATPRSPILGLFSDLVNVPLQYMSDPQRTQQMQGLASFIRGTGLPYSLESLSYDPSGRGLFTGAGGLGGTTRLRPEALEAALTVAPMVGPAARVAGRGAMAIGRAGERYAERVVPQIMERGGLPAEMVAAMGQGTQSPLTVYHGSPYRFNRFDPTKIGSGEGAQSYGYGHYVAEAPGVATGYQKAISKDKFISGQGFFDPSQLEHLNVKAVTRRGDLDEAIAEARKYATPDSDYPETAAKAARDLAKLEALKSSGGMRPNEGSLYKIDLPDEQIARMIDYDKPLSQQPINVQEALANTKNKQLRAIFDYANSPYSTPGLEGEVKTMGEAIKLLGMNVNPAKGSAMLAKEGIPGIRYLDQGSRGTGTGTSNFVVFPGNEDLLRILEVDGQELLNPIMYRDPFGSTVR